MTTAGPFDRGPFLLAALLCEKVLVETDGVKSAIRIIDRMTHTVVGTIPPDRMEPFDYEMTMLIRLKSGETGRGVHPLEVRLVRPSGESAEPFRQNILFEGEEDRGVDVIMKMQTRFDMPGIYWFHVNLSGVSLTKVPFRVVYMPQLMQTYGPGGSPPPAEESPPGA